MFTIKGFWTKKSKLQRILLIAIAVVLLVGLGVLFALSSRPAMVPVLPLSIQDVVLRDRLVLRIEQEGVKVTVSPAGVIHVTDEATARRMRSIISREELISNGTDSWKVFDPEDMIITDFEKEVHRQRAVTWMVRNYIGSMLWDDIENPNVTIVRPADDLLASEQNPITASVIISPLPGSDIAQNREKLEGIMTLLQSAIEGLKAENIVICDNTGLVLNDF